MLNNMKKIILSAASLAVAAVASVSVAPTTSEAVPAFARQTGAACLNCHFGAIPRLAQMGREFRMNGFRDTSAELLEDEHLSIPLAFNASLLMKARIRYDDKTGGRDGNIQWPDESALLFGGRFGEHAGGLQEWDVISGEMLGGKFAYVNDLDAGILAFAIGTSDALGAPSIFNDPSNAISRNTRGIQSRSMALSTQPMIHDAATGLGVYGYMNDSIYFAAGLVDAVGGFGNGNADVVQLKNMGNYARAAWLGDVAGFDSIIGVFYAAVDGKGINLDAAVLNSGFNGDGTTADVTGIDLQMQGEVGGNLLGVYMPIVVSASNDVTGFQLYGNYNLTHAAGVQLGFDTATDASGASDVTTNRLILGGWYDLAQNIAINYEYSSTKTDGSSAVAQSILELEYVY